MSAPRTAAMKAIFSLPLALLAAVGVFWGGGLGSARAWNGTGHEVVALIAWDTLADTTRAKVVGFMAQSPDSRLTNLLPHDGRPLEERQRQFFTRAATWPDLIRGNPGDQPTWHFRDFFWKQQGGHAVDVPDLDVDAENILERLAFIRGVLADVSQRVPERAMLTAWLLHLVGDVHQPLHCSARVTSMEKRGDRGGNDFKLDLRPPPNPKRDRNNLHSYWDGMLDKAVPRHENEGFGDYLRRVADVVKSAHPKSSLAGDFKPNKFEDWARESVAAAKNAYPPSLKRNQAPSDTYRVVGSRVAMTRAALGGYRLAAMLEELFGP